MYYIYLQVIPETLVEDFWSSPYQKYGTMANGQKQWGSTMVRCSYYSTIPRYTSIWMGGRKTGEFNCIVLLALKEAHISADRISIYNNNKLSAI